MQQGSANSNKRPCKGILKTSSSFDKHSGSHRKSAKFDELNVLQTYHPPNKDYGHMKIEEPKTPYNYADPSDPDAKSTDQLDAELLAEKLTVAAKTFSFDNDDNNESSGDEDKAETDEEKSRRVEFEKRRKAHYNEFEAVRLARKLIEEEGDDDEEDKIGNENENENENGDNTSNVESTSIKTKNTTSRDKLMEEHDKEKI